MLIIRKKFLCIFCTILLHIVLYATDFSYDRFYVDTNYGGNGKPGWARAGDMDNDGDMDIVAGGGNGLFVYENDGNAGGWTRYGNLDGSSQIGANGAIIFDVNSDGFLDVVSAKYYNNLGWWENPGPPLSNGNWVFHSFSSETWYLHDIILVDLDQDGNITEFVVNLNSGYWGCDIKIKWFTIPQDPTQPWNYYVIEPGRNEGTPHGHAGMDVGDIDHDGHVDLGFANGWYEAPDNPTGNWTWHSASNIYGISNTLIRDMNGDGFMDLVVSGGHHGQGVFWLENDGSPINGGWTQNNISSVIGDPTKRHYYQSNAGPHVHHPEGLQVEDYDFDGDYDVQVCELFFGEDTGEPGWNQEVHNVYIFENSGTATSPLWNKQNIAPNSYPSHLIQNYDINHDGLLDIISEATGYSVVTFFENTTSSTQTVSAPQISPNGGTFYDSTLVSLETQTSGASIYYTLDDTDPTVNSILFAQPFSLTFNAEVKARAFKTGLNPSPITSASFFILKDSTVFDFDLVVVDNNYPGNGRPGWSASGDLDSDGDIDIVSGGGSAIQWYEAPNWSRHSIELNSTVGGNGGLIFDVDRDGDLDIVAARYMDDLVWFENPAPLNVTGTWNSHIIDNNSALGFNHDLALGDIDGDGMSEVVALYVQTGGVVWYDIPANPNTDPWPSTQILSTTDDPFVGLALGDIDRDGDLDVVISNKWYERPQNPFNSDWTSRNIFSSDVQNIVCYDVNRDGRLDIVAAEGFTFPNGRVLWAEAPIDLLTQPWTEHIVAGNLDGPENLWAGDLDFNGITDIVTGEMGTSTGWNDNDANLIVYEGLDTTGLNWTEHILEENVGVSARINPVDIDEDGDVDFTADGNAEDHIYLWENNTTVGTLPTVATPTIVPEGGTFVDSVEIQLATSTPYASIFYSLDGSTPGTSSLVFTSQFILKFSAQVKARAFREGYFPSSVASAQFLIDSTNVNPPSPPSNLRIMP